VEDDKINLHWGKFFGQLVICLMALICAIFASRNIFGFEEARHAIAQTNFGLLMGVLLIMGTFIGALWLVRVPYQKDVFERRLRNWSMTSAAIIVLTVSVIMNIGFQHEYSGHFIITPYMMPALWLIFYLIHSQYTRYCVAYGRPNSFTGRGPS